MSPNGPRRSWQAISSLLTLLACLVGEISAQPPKPTQSEVQAVYLFNFAKFVRWPAGTEHATLTICIAGQKIYSDTETKIVAGERIDNHPLAVRTVQTTQDVTGCDILFVDLFARDRLDALLAAVAGKPILTVSDAPDSLSRGGMIQFLVIDNRVRFSVDLGAVERSGISLNSELLKVAVKVTGRAGGGGDQ